MNNKFNWEVFIINILIPQLIGLLSVFFAGNISQKYNNLIKPPFSPPAFVFSIVWFVIFFLMGICSYILSRKNKVDTTRAKFYYSAQLGINFLWNILFFGLDKKLFGFFWIILLLIVLTVCYKEFRKVKKICAYLFIPYILWTVYGAYLNLGFWYLNR